MADERMQQLNELSEQQPFVAPSKSGAGEPEVYTEEPLASLSAQRVRTPATAAYSVYHAYPRLSGSAPAYCAFRDDLLRLDVFGKTYVLHDESEQREVPFRFPEWFAHTVKTDSLAGSFPCEVWKLRNAPVPYLVFWLYPHEPKVHAWAVHENGHRRNGFDLPRSAAARFLSHRAGRNVMFSYRLLLLAQAEQSKDTDRRLDTTVSDLFARVVEVLPKLDVLAADNVDEWGEDASFLSLLQRLGLSTVGATCVLDRLVRHVHEVDRDWHRLPSVLVRRKLEAFAQAQIPESTPTQHTSLTNDDRLRRIIDALNRGQSLPALLTPEVMSWIPASRLQGLLRIGDDVTIRVMTPAEQETAANRSATVVLFRVTLRPRLSIDVALPRFFSSLPEIRDFLLRFAGALWPIWGIYTLVLCLSDMIMSSDVRFRTLLRRDLGRIPDFLEFYAFWGDICGHEGIATFCRKKGTTNVLIPDPYFYRSDAYARWKALQTTDVPKWSERKPAAIWRGGTSGREIVPGNICDNARINLVFHCKEYSDLFDAKITLLTQMGDDVSRHVGEILRNDGLLEKPLSPADYRNYMFSIDIDGNANAWGFFEKLALGLCVLKVESPYEQWYYADLKPWKHYVPVDPTLSDLIPTMQELRNNLKMAKTIAESAFEFAVERDIPSEAIALCGSLANGVATGAVLVSP